MTKISASVVSVLILVPLPFANMEEEEEPMTFTAAIQRVRFLATCDIILRKCSHFSLKSPTQPKLRWDTFKGKYVVMKSSSCPSYVKCKK